MQKYVRRASLALRSGASSFVVNAQQRTTSVNTFPVRAYAASGESPVPLISTALDRERRPWRNVSKDYRKSMRRLKSLVSFV